MNHPVGLPQPLGETSTPAVGQQLRVLGSGDVAIQAILNRVRNAERSVDIRAFLWRDDEAGCQLADAVLEAADRGARVTIHKDKIAAVEARPIDAGFGAANAAWAWQEPNRLDRRRGRSVREPTMYKPPDERTGQSHRRHRGSGAEAWNFNCRSRARSPGPRACRDEEWRPDRDPGTQQATAR